MMKYGLLCMLIVLFSAFPVFPVRAHASVFTKDMIRRSLVSIGNTTRLHCAIQKAKDGMPVSIVYLGGSITEGALAQPQTTHCYAYRSAQLFAKRFMSSDEQLRYHNAGISGTPSLLGITRCAQDVLLHKPDLVFVEFAVNDSSDPTSQMVYESLIRKLLQSESKPAIVLLFTRMEGGYTAQPHMQQIGKHYDLPMISIGNAITPEILAGNMKWEDYSSDYAHPTTAGHAFIADMIDYYFELAAQEPAAPEVFPEQPLKGNALEHLFNLTDGHPSILSTGSFSYGPVNCYSYHLGWFYNAATGNEPLVIQTTGTHFTFAFKQEKDLSCGTAEVFVDGTLKATLPGYSETAWGNVITQLVVMDTPDPHTIHIRMAEQDATQRFSLLDIGIAHAE